MDELEIIKYLDGDMGAEEKSRFEEELKSNPELSAELENYRSIQELAYELLSKGDASGDVPEDIDKEVAELVKEYRSGDLSSVPDNFREQVLAAEREQFGYPKPGNSMYTVRRIWYSAAALVVVALSIYILMVQPFRKMSASELYAEYFSTLVQNERISEIARSNNDFYFAIEVYEAGDFERSAVLFEMLYETEGTDDWAGIYTASSYLQLNQATKAIEVLEQMKNRADPSFESLISWHLILSYLKSGETEKSKQILITLKSDPDYGKNARRILQMLE